MKPLWIFVAGTPRSGSTTQYSITRTIVEDKNKGIGIAYHQEEKLRQWDNSGHDIIVCKVFAPLFEYYYDNHQNMSKKTSYGQKIYDENRLKCVCTVRNPLDMVASMKRRDLKRDGTFNFDRVLRDLPRHLGDVVKWIDLGPEITYWSKYEDYTQHLPNETLHIANHIGVGIGSKEHHRIGNMFKIEEIEARKGQEHNKPDESQKRHLPSVPAIVFGMPGAGERYLSKPEQKAVKEVAKEFIERFYPEL